jgi:uncharacterized protein involved in response to NO
MKPSSHHAIQLLTFDAGAPVFALGFRPFYLLAASFAFVAIPVWIAVYAGFTSIPATDLLWHVHEMVFGFAMAVVAGFLLTAVQNWTAIPTLRGRALQGLALLWLAGRCAALSGPSILFWTLDVAFPLVLALYLLRLLLRANNRRNLPICVILGLLAAADFVFHAARAGSIDVSPLLPVHASILLLILLVTIIGGRVIPMFTRNGAPGSRPRQWPLLDQACLALLALAFLSWLFVPLKAVSITSLILSGSLQTIRLATWNPLATWRYPLVWTLHLSYSMLVAGVFLLAGSIAGLCSTSTAFHMLAVGAMSGMICAMITRTALGHTGRLLRAGGAEIGVFSSIALAALLRLGANLTTNARPALLVCAAAAWSIAFLFYLSRYAFYLMRPRMDGRPG